jgi:hypothetical protein
MEGPLVHQMEAAFVAVEEGEFGRGGEFAESGIHAGELAAGGLLLHRVFEHFGFEGPGAAEAPVGGGEFLDEAELEIVDGGEALDEDVAEGLEVLRGLVADENLFGKEALSDGISGRVGAIGLETLLGDSHDGYGGGSALATRVAGGWAGVSVS